MLTTTDRKLIVPVTQEHIDNGVPGDPKFCPIALALDDVLPEGLFASVIVHEFALYGQRRIGWVALPALASDFILRVDHGDPPLSLWQRWFWRPRIKPLAPFTFEIELPELPE